MRSAIQRWCEHPRAPLIAVLLSMMLCAPALTTGLAADDFYHRIILLGLPGLPWVPSDLWSLFVWADGDPAHAHAFMDVGMVGWWSNPELKMAYARPITALTHALDHRLFPDSPLLMHLHSLLWFAAALWVLRGLYAALQPGAGRFTPTAVATLTLCLFAFDDAHGLTLSWIANRNALVVLFFGSACLRWHVRARTGVTRTWGATAMSTLCLALGLGSGEASLAFCGYLAAYALLLDREGPVSGVLRLWPQVLVALAWAALYRAHGFGASGSGLVVDPVGEPLRFLAALAERLPILLAAQFAMPPADLWEFYGTVAPWLPAVIMGVACALFAVLVATLWPLLRRDASARFWALSVLLAAVPVCAQFPHDRLLMVVGVGGAGLMGQLLGALFGADRALGRTRRWVAGALAFVHLGMAPLLLPLRVRAPADIAKMVGTADRSIPDDPGVRARTVVLINPPVDAYAGYVPPLRVATGRPRPAHLHWLASGSTEVEVLRTDAHTLRVRPRAGFLSQASERMQRGDDPPMRVGDQVKLTEMQVTISEVGADGRPTEATVRFRRPLEDPALQFLAWREGAFRPWPLPRVGQTVRTRAVDLASLLP